MEQPEDSAAACIGTIVSTGSDMKNSKEFSGKIQQLYRTLIRKYPKVQPVSHEDVAEAVVYGMICHELPEQAAEAAMKRFRDYFVDWNELRVSRSEEVVDVLGKDTPASRNIASTMIKVLGGIFNEHHRVSLEGLKKIGKRPAKQALEKIDGISRFVVDYCMLTSLQGHAIPLTDQMVEYLKSNELADPDANEQEIGGFLAKQISAKKGYEFYALLRAESESPGSTKEKTNKTPVKKKPQATTKTTKRAKK